MSQFFVQTPSGGTVIPPSVPESFVTDSGTSIPAANVLNVNGGSTSNPNDNGIQTLANPNLSSNLQISLTNRLTGSGTSTNGSVVSLITYALGVSAAVYRFQFDVAGRDTGILNGLGYTVFASAKTNGVIATVIASPFIDNDEDGTLLAASADFVASGNNVILQVTGVVGETIVYKAVGQYIVV